MRPFIIKRFSGIALILILLGGGACKKVLDLQPHNSTFTEAYFQTGTDANTAIAGAYALLRSVLLNNYSWHIYGDVPSAELNIINDAFTSSIASGQFIGLNVSSQNWNWANYYQLIQQVNLIINKVPGIPIETFTNQDDKKRIVGEAYFLRAYTYFYMSRIWGGVPLKLAPDLDVSQSANIARSPVTTVYAQCLADCQTAESMLTFGYSDPTQAVVRANKGAVLALTAHIQAWTHDYASCEKTADTLIRQGGYTLVDSAHYSQIFVGRSTEGIFEININTGQNEGIATLGYNGNTNGYLPTLAYPFIAKQGTLNWATNPDMLKTLYGYHPPDTIGDPTADGDTLTDIRWKKDFYQATSGVGQTIKYANITYADGSAQNDPRLSNNLNIFRLADIFLLRAEALNALGRDAEAIPLLDTVRTRAGLVRYNDIDTTYPAPPHKPPLAIAILNERLKELFFEGQAYYDLIRTNQLTNYNHNFFVNQYLNGGWLWPIDPAMFKDDFLLVQTPYWQGKI
jgi:hypothetical protein